MKQEYIEYLTKDFPYNFNADVEYKKRYNFHILTNRKKQYCGCCGKELNECRCDIKKRDLLDKKYKYKTKVIYPYNSCYHITSLVLNNNLLIRYFVINVNEEINKKYVCWCKEVMRLLITPNGKIYQSTLDIKTVYYTWDFKYDTILKVKSKIKDKYIPTLVKNQLGCFKKPLWMKYINIKSLYKINEAIRKIRPYNYYNLKDFILEYLKLPTTFETLIKCKRYDLLGYLLEYKDDEKEIMKLLKHNKYIPNNDWRLYHDYINGLKMLNKDTKNIKVLCPADFTAANKSVNKQCNKIKNKIELENNIKLYNTKYINRVNCLLGLVFGNDKIVFSILPDVKAFSDEADSMCHCVYRMNYYRQENSYIFSVREKETNKRLETAELKLTNNKLEVSQCYGYGDKPTKYHNQIINLLNTNLNDINNIISKTRRMVEK